MTLNKRIKRVLLENKAPYIGSVILIIFSSFSFTLMRQFALNFERLHHEFITGYVQEDATFRTDKAIENLPELELAANATIEKGRTLEYRLSEEKSLRIFSLNEKINMPGIIEGKKISRTGEMLMDKTFADVNNYHTGDQLTIFDRTFTIVGLMSLPNYIYTLQSVTDMMPNPDFGVAVISKEDFIMLGNGISFYSVKFNPGEQSSKTGFVRFRELLQAQGIQILEWTDIEDNKRANIVAAEVDILHMVSKSVPIGILLLASLMVGNVVRRLIKRETAEIGALYALGYKRNEILRHYLTIPLLIAVTGGITGTILGMFPVRSMVIFMTTSFPMPLTGIQFDPFRLIIGLLLPLIFLMCSGYLVIRKILKHSPVELMGGRQEEQKVNFLERWLRLEKFNFAAKFRIREQLRSLSRIAFLITGIIVATILLQWGFSMKTSVDFLLSDPMDIFNFEYEYKFDNLRQETLPEGAIPFSASLFVAEPGDKRDFYVTGVKPDSTLLTLVDESGAALSTDRIIIMKPLATLLNIEQEGDTATFIRKLDGKVFLLKVDGIADSYAGKFIFMPLEDYNNKFGFPEGSYNGAFSNVLLDIPENESFSLTSLEDKYAGVEEIWAPVKSLIGLIATIAFIIGVIVIYVVTSLVIEENTKTISLMKIFGYRKREVNALILNSSMIFVVVGYVIGIPLTMAAIDVLIRSMERSVGMMLPATRIGLPYILIGFVVVMLSYELSKLLCRKKVNAVSMNVVLKPGIE